MKLWFGILVCSAGLLLMGCQLQTTTTADYEYVEYQGDRYVFTELNTYQFEDQTISLIEILDGPTVITASFMEETIRVTDNGATVTVNYPDGCSVQYSYLNNQATVVTQSLEEDHAHLPLLHLELAELWVQTTADDSEDPVYWTPKRVWLLVLEGVIMALAGLIVFFPHNAEKLIILSNRIIPRFEEPVHPTQWNLTGTYLSSLFFFLLSLFFVFYTLWIENLS